MRHHSVVIAVIAVVLTGVLLFRGSLEHSLGTPPQAGRDAASLEYGSDINDPTLYERAFSAAASVASQPHAVAVVVNHHLLAAHLIAATLWSVRDVAPDTVVIVSPDHFGRGRAPVSTVNAGWRTPYGVLAPASAHIHILTAAGVVDEYAYPFAGEHGVYNITPFIKRVFPNAEIVPVILKDTAPPEAADALARQLAELPGRVLLVGSLDFTHDATPETAQRNDARSTAILEAGDIRRIGEVAVDSHAALRVVMTYAGLKGADFKLMQNTNSAVLTGRPNATDVTSYITGVWVPKSGVLQ